MTPSPWLAAVFLVLIALPAAAQPTMPRDASSRLAVGPAEFTNAVSRSALILPMRRAAQPADLLLLSLGGVGGGLAAGAAAVALNPPVAARVALYGLGVAAGTTLTGRLRQVEGAPLGAFLGAAVGAGLVLLVAQTSDDESLADGASVGLLALVIPPIFSTGGYVFAPTLLPGRSPGLALRVVR